MKFLQPSEQIQYDFFSPPQLIDAAEKSPLETSRMKATNSQDSRISWIKQIYQELLKIWDSSTMIH